MNCKTIEMKWYVRDCLSMDKSKAGTGVLMGILCHLLCSQLSQGA